MFHDGYINKRMAKKEYLTTEIMNMHAMWLPKYLYYLNYTAKKCTVTCNIII